MASIRGPLILFCSFTLLCAGCMDMPVKVADSVLTSGASLSQGKRTMVSTFGHDDYIDMLVDFEWPISDRNGGVHKVEWKWFKGDALVSRSRGRLIFASSPWTLRTQRAASTLGTGDFEVETIVDDTVVAKAHFTIVS